jgi:hypothetical protein
VGGAAALLIAVIAVSAWNTQRTDTPQAKAPKPWPKPAAPLSSDPRDLSRVRPERERVDRPGDKPRPALEEFRAKVLKEFRSGDRNDDGYLSRDEVRARFAGIEREFERVDSDGDGRISPEEFWRLRQFQAQQKFKKQ